MKKWVVFFSHQYFHDEFDIDKVYENDSWNLFNVLNLQVLLLHSLFMCLSVCMSIEVEVIEVDALGREVDFGCMQVGDPGL